MVKIVLLYILFFRGINKYILYHTKVTIDNVFEKGD
nr:MAG TPA: hypothetical protein [Caudoviricetes sp.]